MTAPSAEILEDSVSPSGDRLTTFLVTFHRFVLAEVNTHRVFSRNSASSRAIPVEKRISMVLNDPADPVVWPCEQPGMQGGNDLTGQDLDDAINLWTDVRRYTANRIARYVDDHPDKSTRLHKSLLNRPLEPYMWHTAVITATDWDGFWAQRVSPLAQPEFNAVAALMRDAMSRSWANPLGAGAWHMPFVDAATWHECLELGVDARHVSVARCARTSYLTHDGNHDVRKEVELYQKLVSASPPHWSPLEHVATPSLEGVPYLGNFRGWQQLRHSVEL